MAGAVRTSEGLKSRELGLGSGEWMPASGRPGAVDSPLPTPYLTKIRFGIITCTPTFPSTSSVTVTSHATLVSM